MAIPVMHRFITLSVTYQLLPLLVICQLHPRSVFHWHLHPSVILCCPRHRHPLSIIHRLLPNINRLLLRLPVVSESLLFDKPNAPRSRPSSKVPLQQWNARHPVHHLQSSLAKTFLSAEKVIAMATAL